MSAAQKGPDAILYEAIAKRIVAADKASPWGHGAPYDHAVIAVEVLRERGWIDPAEQLTDADSDWMREHNTAVWNAGYAVATRHMRDPSDWARIREADTMSERRISELIDGYRAMRAREIPSDRLAASMQAFREGVDILAAHDAEVAAKALEDAAAEWEAEEFYTDGAASYFRTRAACIREGNTGE